MTELLPYEEQLNSQWNDLPLPDVNMAWADMKSRLDEEKRRPLPFWLRGCAGWVLLGLLVAGLGWWIVRPEKWFMKKENGQEINKTGTSSGTILNDHDTTRVNKPVPVNTTGQDLSKDTASNKERSVNNDPVSQPPANNNSEKEKTVKKTIEKLQSKKDGSKGKTSQTNKRKQTVPVIKKPVTGTEVVKPTTGNKDSTSLVGVKPDTATTRVPAIVKADTVSIAKRDTATLKNNKTDSVAKATPDTVKPRKKLSFSTGIGLHQQLPIAGQQWSPYSSSGRKASLADYIPSVYLRLTKPGKWFLQSEFRYGAPQHIKEFAFRQVNVPDTGQNPAFNLITTTTLKKTFYHQLPLSFNYYVLPNWSVGAGMQWNKFYSAIVERDMVRHDNLTQSDSSLEKFTRVLEKDSATEFRKSYWQAVIQTQYQWKRFTFGARYSAGLQPYISFGLPGAAPQQEKNNAMQVYILFQLWRSKEK